jgi:hypothetical protein
MLKGEPENAVKDLLLLPFSFGLGQDHGMPEVRHSGQAKREPESRAVDYSRM